MVRSSKTPAFWSRSCCTRRRFKVFVGLLESLYGVTLPFPDFRQTGRSSFKDYLSAILERRKHPWDVAVKRLGLDSRVSIGMSLFLFRKVVPADKPSTLSLLEKVAKPSIPPPGRFMEFVRTEVNRLMPIGWDRDYPIKCIASVVPVKSYSELDGVSSCSREWFLNNTGCGQWDARASFVEVALAAYEPFLSDKDESRLTVVSSGGKYRALSIPPVRMNYLRPLHKCMYDYLTRYKWLLRGDAKASSFQGFESKLGEVYCSGDYESATDNLNQELQKEILRLVLQNARHVPQGVVVSAMRSFALKLSVYDRDGNRIASERQRSGQMMGNLLSFPLLCLTNYVTFRWLTMDLSIPVRINGDDIVFRARPEVVERWKQGVSSAGLVLSEGKTMVNCRYFTLNSTLFKGQPKGCRLVPFIRSKALFGLGDEDSVASLRGRYYSFCPNYGSSRKGRAREVFLRENSGWIRKSCRSVTRGLGISVQPEILVRCKLMARELRYLALSDESPIPNLRGEWGHLPAGYHLRWVDRETKKKRDRDPELNAAFIEAAWRRRRDAAYETRSEAYCRGLDLSDAVILRTKGWVTRMTRLGGSFLTKIYGEIRKMFRWIQTRWSQTNSSFREYTKKRFACWYADKESKPVTRFVHTETRDVDGTHSVPETERKTYECSPLLVEQHGFDQSTIEAVGHQFVLPTDDEGSYRVDWRARERALPADSVTVPAVGFDVLRRRLPYVYIPPPWSLVNERWLDFEERASFFLR